MKIFIVSIAGHEVKHFKSRKGAEAWLRSQGARQDPKSGDWYTIDEDGEAHTWYSLQEKSI
jgi:hypothetical protein